MSYNNKNVPVIAITPDDGINDFDTEKNIDEAATDVEDIYFQSEKRKKKSKRQNIKRDAYATDVEDMEGSDDDTISPLVKHTTPLSLNDIMLAEETPVVEESFKSNQKTPKMRPKLKSQTSIGVSKHFLELDDMDSYQVLTDLEDFDASDEDDEASDIETSDTDLLKEIIHDSGSIAISDSVKKFLQSVPSPMITPDVSENETQKKSNSKSLKAKKPSRHYISPSSISPHLSDITDTEMIHYDSNDEMKVCKQKHKYSSKGRRHTAPGKYKPDTSDSDQDESENELTALRRVTVSDLGEIDKLRLQSSGGISNNSKTIHEIESDEEENAALYPARKSVIKKPSSNLLTIVQDPDEGVTDTEDVEGDYVPEEAYTYDENAINLSDYENSGGVIQEKDSIKLSKNLNKLAETKIYRSKQHDDSNEESTDEEEDVMAEEKEDDKVEITEDINIKFIRNKRATTSKKNKVQEKNRPVNTLCPPSNTNDEALTDVENLNSSDDSDDENENGNEIPITIANNDSVDNETDSESVEGEVQTQLEQEVDESSIPPVSRKIIRETEVGENKFSVVSTNINDDDNESDIINNKTDIEDFSGDELEEENITTAPEVTFELCDVEKIDHKDSLNIPNCDDDDEGETDLEDIENIQKPARSKRTKRFLHVDNDDNDKLTDVEDIILNETGNSDYLGVEQIDKANAKTDVEDFDASDNDQEQAVPEYCRTPDIMRQMGGETVCSQEGSGHFTKQDLKKLNEKHRSFSIPEVSPSPTLTDEFMASADDEIYTRTETVTPSQMTQALDEVSHQNIHSQSSKKMDLEADEEVMYLKGGGFLPDAITDTEEMGISDEEYVLANEAGNKVWINIQSDQNQQVLKFAEKQNALSVSCLQENVLDQEWGPAKGTSSAGESVGESSARDAAHQDTGAARISGNQRTFGASCSKPTSLNPSTHTNTFTSYTQLDEILDHMLAEVDEQERLVQLDESDKTLNPICVNSIKLDPSTDAIIEIPISHIPKSPKIYETKHEFQIDISTDLCDLDDDIGSIKTLNKSQDTDSLISFESISEMYFMENINNKQRASSESLGEIESNNERAVEDEHIYETIESPKDPYKLYADTHESNRQEIWWEGTYRDLSIVPEEDEDNISEISELHKYVLDQKANVVNPSYMSNISNIERHTVDDSSSDISQTTGDEYDTSDLEHNVLSNRPVKAEVKLLVKTLDRGKEDVEIRTVREFTDNTKTDRYPVEDNSAKPSFTLQRLFVRCPDSAPVCRNYPELIAASNTGYPLQYDPNKHIQSPNVKLIDLYANTPFFPCYGSYEKKNTTPSEPFPTAYCDWLLQPDDAAGGNTTSPSIILRNEDKVKLVTGETLSSHNIKTSDTKPTLDETKPLITTETVSVCITNPGQPTIKSPDEDKASKELDNKKEKSKSKGGFFSSLKSLVGRSFDSSDSESKEEKTPKKKKKKEKGTPKKDKKSKEENIDISPSKSGKPISPVQEQPKALYESNALDNIPAIDETEVTTIQVTDLDADPITTDEVKIQATTIVDNVIKDSKKAASHILNDKIQEFNLEGTVTPEEVRRSTEPIIINEDEFLVVIEPKLNNDYEDIQSPDELITLSPKVEEAESKSDTLKSRKSTGFMKLFSKKDSKESDDESRAEDLKQSIDKQDKPEKHEEHRKSTGFFGLFSKKSKDDDKKEEHKDIILKEEPGVEYSKEMREFSPEVQQQMVDSTNFLMSEIEYFEDVRPIIKKTKAVVDEPPTLIIVDSDTQQEMLDSADFIMKEVQFFEDVRPQPQKPIIKEEVAKTSCDLAAQNLSLSPTVQQQMIDSAHFLLKENELFEDVRPKIESEKTSQFVESPKSTLIEFSPEVQQQMVESADFLMKEVEFFEDVKLKEVQKKVVSTDAPVKPKESTNIKEPKVEVTSTDKQDTLKESTNIKKGDDTPKEVEQHLQENEQTESKPHGFFSKLGFGSKSVDKKDENKDKKKQKKKKEKKPGFFTKFGEKFSSSSQEDKNYLSSDDDSKLVKPDLKDKKLQLNTKIEASNVVEEPEEFKERSVTIIGKIMDDSKQSMNNIADVIAAETEQIQCDMKNTTHEIQEQLSTDKEKVKESVIVKVHDADTADKTKLALSDIGANVNDATNSIVTLSTEKVQDESANLEEKINISTNAMITSLNKFGDSVNNSVEKEKDQFIATKEYNDQIKLAEDLTKQSVEKTEDIIRSLNENANKAEQISRDKIIEKAGIVKEGIYYTAEKTQDDLIKAGEAVKDKAESAKESLISTQDASIEKVKDRIEKVEDVTKESAEKTGGFFSSLGIKAKKAGKDTKDSIEIALESGKDKIKEGAEIAKEEINDTADKTQDSLNKAGEAVKDKADSAKERIISTKDASIEKVKDGMEKVEDVTKESVEKTGGFFSSLGRKVKKAGKDTKDAIDTAAESGKEKIQEETAIVKEGIKDTADKTQDNLYTAGETVKDKADSVKEKIISTKEASIEKVKDGMEKVENVTKESVEKTGGFFSSLGKKAKKAGKDSKDAIGTAAESGKEKIQEETANVKEGIEDTAGKTQDTLIKAGEAVKDKADSAKESLISTKEASIEKVKDGIEKVEDVTKDSVEKTGGFFSSLGKKAKQAGKDTKDSIETATESGKEKIKEEDANVKEGIKDTAVKTQDNLSKAGEAVKEKAASAKENLIFTKDASIEKVKDGIEKVEDVTAESVEKTGGFFSGLGKKAKKAGKDTKDSIKTSAESGQDKIKEGTANAKEGIKDAADKTQDTLIKVGEIVKDKAENAKESLISTKDASIEKVKDGMEKVEDVTKDSVEKTGGFFSSLGKKAKKAGKDTKDAIDTAADSGKEKIQEGTSNVKEGIKDTAGKTQDTLIEAGEAVKDKADSAKESLISTKDASIEKVKDGFEKVEDVTKESVEKTGGFFSSLGKKAKQTGQDTKESIETAAESVKEKLKEEATNVKEGIKDTSDKTQDNLNDASEAVKEKVESAKESIIATKDASIEKVKVGIEKVEDVTAESVEKTGGFFSGLGKKAKKAGKDTKDSIKTAAESRQDKIKEGSANAKEGIKNTADKTQDTLIKVGEIVKDKAENAKESLISTKDASIEKVKDGMEKVEDVTKDSVEKTGGFFSSLGKKAKKAGKDTKDAIDTAAESEKEKIQEGTSNIKEGIKDTAGKTQDALIKAGEAVKDKADSAKESLISTKDASIEKVKDGIEKVEDETKQSVEKTGGFFTSLSEKAKQAGNDTKDSIETAAESGKEKIKDEAANVKDGIKDTAVKTQDNLSKASEAIKDKAASAKDNLISSKDASVENVKDGIEKIEDVTKESVEKTGGFFSSLGKKAKKTGKDTKDAVDTAAESGKEKIIEETAKVKEGIKDTADKTQDTLSKAGEIVKDNAKIAKDSLISTKDASTEKVKDGIEKVEDFTKESVEKTGGFFSSLGKKAKKAGKNTKDAVGTAAESGKEKIKEETAKVKEGIKDTADKTQDTLSKAAEIVKDNAGIAKESLISTKEASIEQVKDGFEKVEDVTKESVEKSGGFFSSLGKKAKKAGKDTKDVIDTAAESGKEKIQEGTSNVKEGIKDTAGKTQDTLIKAGEAVEDKADSAKESLISTKEASIEKVKDGIEKVEDVTKDSVEKTGGFFSSLGKKAKQAGKDTKDSIETAAESGKEKIKEKAANVKEGIEDTAVKTQDNLSKAGEVVKDKSASAKENLISTKDASIEKAKDGIEKVEDVTKESVEKTGGFFSSLGKKAKKAGKDTKDAIETAAESGKEKIQDGTSNVKEGIKDTAGKTQDALIKAGEAVKDKADSAKENLISTKDVSIEKVKDGIEKVEDVTKESVEKTGDFFSSLGMKAKQAGKDTKDFIETAAESGQEKIKEKAANVKEGIEDTGVKTQDNLSKAGEVVKDKSARAKENLISTKDASIDKVKDGIEKVEDVTKESVEKTEGFFSSLGKKIKKGGKDTKDAIGTAVETGKDKIQEETANVKEGIKDTAGKTQDTLIKAGEAVKDKADSAKESLISTKDASIEKVKDGIENVEEVTKESVEKTGGFFSSLGKKAKKTGKDTKDAVNTAAESGKEKIKEETANVKEGIKDTAVKTQDNLSKAGEAVKDKAASLKENLISTKDASVEKVKDGIEKVEDVTKESVEKTGGFFSSLSKKAKKTGKDTKDAVDAAAESGKEKIQEETSKVKEGIKDTADKTQDTLIKAGETIKDKAESAKESLISTKDASIEKVKDGIEKVEDVTKDSIEKTGSFCSSLGEKAKKVGKETSEGFKTTAKSGKDKIKDETTIITEGIKDSANKVQDGLYKTGETIKDQANNANVSLVSTKDTIVENFKDSVEQIEDVTKDTVEKTGGFFSSLGKKAKKSGKETKEGIEKAAVSGKDQIEESAADIKVGFVNLADRTQNTFSNVGEDIKDSSNNAQDSLGAIKDSSIDKLHQGIEMARDLTDESAQKTNDFISSLDKKAKLVEKETKDSVEVAVESDKDKIKAKLKGTSDKAQDALNKASETITDSIENTKENLKAAAAVSKDKIEDLTECVKDDVKSSADKSKAAINNTGEIIKENLTASRDVGLENIKDAAEKAEDLTKETVEKTGGFFSNFGKKAKKAGKDVKETVDSSAVAGKEKVKDELHDISDETKFALCSPSEKVKESLASAKDTSVNQIESTFKKMTVFADTSTDSVKDAKQELEELNIKIEGPEEEPVEFKKMQVFAKEVTETTADGIKDSKQELKKAVDEISNKVKDSIEDPVEFLKCAKQESGKAKEEALEPVINQSKGLDNQATDFICYVTTPTMQRKGIGGSQRIGKDNRPPLLDVSNMPVDSSSDEDEYIVTEPAERQYEENISSRGSPIVIETIQECDELEKETSSSLGVDTKRKPLFHIGSRDEESISESVDLGEKIETQSTQLETTQVEADKKLIQSDAKADIDLIEDKLLQLGKALDDLEKVNIELEPQDLQTDEKSERKLRRVERRFERMASETMEKDIKEAKEQQQMTSPEVEAKREEDFRTIVSQLSQEEVSECQKLYSTLWDDATFTPSEEWDSKTPDSQPDDIQDLPQGEVVYMGPVTLNKDHLTNKAGIEVDVIPIKRSPCTSPLPKRKLEKQGRAKSAMGFYKEKQVEIDERGSLPDLQSTGKLREIKKIQKGSIMSAILKSNPNILKDNISSSSTNSVYFNAVDNNASFKRRLSTDSLTKGNVVSAVKEWMARSTPFGSTDNIRSTDAISLADTTNSLFDDDDNDSVDLQSESVYHLESESSKSDNHIPDILIYNDVNSIPTTFYDSLHYVNNSNNQAGNDIGVVPATSLTRRILSSLDQFGLGETSGGPLTNLTKEGPIHHATNLDQQPAELTLIPIPKPKPRVDKTPDKSKTLLDDSSTTTQESTDLPEDTSETYSDKKKFWENVTSSSKKEDEKPEISVKKRMSLFEEQIYKQEQEQISSKKRTSVHEISMVPPVPKPRSTVVQSSSEEQSTSTDSQLQEIIEVKEIVEEKPEPFVSEYKSSFKDPNLIQDQPSKTEKQEDEPVVKTEQITEISKTESVDSEAEYIKYEHQAYENPGYISESDQELDSSTKEELDSVPKIKRRQMSISQPPVAAARKTIFERSVSLPTEDLQDVSAKSVKARKQYFEQQIKNEMVIDQLMTQLEEEEPQEYKTLTGTAVSKKVMSPEEKIQVETIITSVRETEKDFKDVAKETEKKLSPMSSSSRQDTRTEDDITQYTPTSVKDLAKYFQPNLLCDYMPGNNFPLTTKEDTTDAQQIEVSSTPSETLQKMQHSSTESEQSISSERSIELGSADELVAHLAEVLQYRSDNISRPSDSLEVHVDKSEIEDSEKVVDIEQDGTDGENKSFSAEEYLSETESKSADKIDVIQGESKKSSMELISPIREHKELVVDTTWEVSIETQPMSVITETVTDIPIERQVIVEKDEEFTEITKQQSSESCDSEKVKSDHSEVEQLLLESLYHQKVNPDDAIKIASELVSDIEAEIERRNLVERNEIEDIEPPVPPAEVAKNQISDYLRQLAEAKGLDAKEVELVETVLARKQSELSKLGRHDTQTSSMEITDEDLKYSAEYDISPSESHENILEEQIEQLEFESQASDLKEKSSVDEVKFSEKSSDSKSRDILAQQDREFYSDDILVALKSKTVGTVVTDFQEEKDVLKKSEKVIEDGTSQEKILEQLVESRKDTEQTDLTTNIEIKTDTSEHLEKVATNILDTQSKEHVEKVSSTKTVTETSELEEAISEEQDKKNICLEGSKDIEISSHQETDAGFVDVNKTESTKALGNVEEKTLSNVQHKQETITAEDGSQIFSEEIKEKTHTKTVTTSQVVDHKREEKTSVTTYIQDGKDDTTATFSDDSKSSTYESAKSPAEAFSSSSSPRKDDTDTLNVFDKPEVILRKKLYKDIDTSSSSSNLKIDRRSGADFEAYSSSGESHYHSFEDSARSRPCSSDVEGLVAAGSSEYESALTSQDVSSKSHITSTEYHTAVSSISSQSMKSLDSESSGHLGSIEVSEASETLVASEVPSNFDLDGDILDGAMSQLLEDDLVDSTSNDIIEPYDREIPEHVIRGDYQVRDKKSSFDTISDSDIHGESMDISEEDSPHEKNLPGEITGKMKRSQEMTFQPIPKAIIPDSPQSDALEMDERFGTSLEDGSVLSVSLSSQSDATALRTVIEQSRRDSDRLDASITISGHDSMTASNQSLDNILPPISSTTDTSTSTGSHVQEPFGSVTLTTSTVDDNGISSVSTQVTSQYAQQNDVINGPTQVDYVPEYDDVVEPKKVRGHRRQESTSFVPSMIPGFTPLAEKFKSTETKLTESVAEMTLKEEHHEETKDVDEMEESYETEADQCFHRQQKESGVLDTESDQDADKDDSESRPQSRISKTDSEVERGMSTAISEDKDSELIALMNQGSMDVFSEPIERPLTPEPPLESRGSIEGIPSLPTTPKSKICGSEKSSIEEGEAEAAFSMVAHISPAHKAKGDICPIMEDEDAEKHELETRERAQKELEKRRAQILRDQSPGNIPDIMVTEHMTPLVDREFHYPDLELEEKEALAKSAPQTPASVSSKSSEDTDQGREYILDDTHQVIPEEPETESAQDDKQMTESRSELSQSTTVEERTVYEPEPKEPGSVADSPNSDSFEMLEKPDIIDDFVVIEEVAKEAAEQDEEGKSVQIAQTKYIRKHDEEVEEYLVKSAPTPLTRMTELKYFPDGASSGDEVGPFDFEDSPPQAGKKSTGVKTVKADSNVAQSYGFEYDRELEASKKWIEMQFQGDQAAMINAGYGYEMEFERGPLEDIKEEEATDFESSRIGSLDSQKHSIGSLGSVKDSFSSTPEYDVLAGRKFFTRSGEHDDVSMSSLQEFEHLERAISLENRRQHQGSQDSSSNGSFSKRYQASRSGQGDDVSMSSLKEFEGLETACIEAHKIEVIAKEEEALLAQIDEAQENLISESESCKSTTAEKKTLPESEEEDYEKRMFEIDEIIKQAQSNVEKFIDMKDVVDKTESMGRGDSLEEVAKVPDLELDEPLVKSTVHTVKWGTDDIMQTSTDSLDQKVEHRASIDSLDMKTNAADIMTQSTDSIEFQLESKPTKDNLMTDSIDIPDPDRSYMITSDSLELTPGSLMQLGQMSDSIDEDGSRIRAIGHDQSSSSGFSMSKDEQEIQDQRAEYLLGSTDSLDPTSSTATHATYQYETDSVMSGSFTSGGSNTMVSSTDTIDPMGAQAQGVDLAAAVRKVWFDEDAFGAGSHFTTELLDDGSKPYVTEVIEPCEGDPDYSHTIHRKVQLPPEIKKITFKGPDADLQLRQYIENFGEGEDVHETQETDKDGNIHVKRVVQKRFVVKSDPSGEEKRISGPELESYLQQVTHSGDEFDFGLTKQTRTDSDDSTKVIYGQKFSTQHFEGQGEERAIKELLSSIASDVTQSTTYAEQNLTRHVDKQQEQQSGSTSTTFSGVTAANVLRAQGSRRKPLRYDISVDDQTEVDPREHDWRFILPRHDEAPSDDKPEESDSTQGASHQRNVSDQHQLSSEMKELLEEMEKQSKQ